MPIDPATLSQLGLDQPIAATVNGRVNGVTNAPEWDQAYHPCAEAYPEPDVPQGAVHKFAAWTDTTVYAGTSRDIWVYQPTRQAEAYRVILFNDGAWYLSRRGPVRATSVLDVLHHNHEIAPTVAVFINPGKPDHHVRGPIESYDDQTAQRSFEYDQMTAQYGQFLFHEVLPFVEQACSLTISDDPQHRTTCGISSGGMAAFMSAWQHPDQCQRVISHCGSFTDIWGGHNTPSLLRHNPRKPLRVFLQSGENDANTPFGNWPLANQAMASALQWAGYDYRFEFGSGGHNLQHGGAIFADTLRWIWRQD
ncbi:MAG: alpha/beta hydrolase-fold protein [Pseudomonadota bacterium]